MHKIVVVVSICIATTRNTSQNHSYDQWNSEPIRLQSTHDLRRLSLVVIKTIGRTLRGEWYQDTNKAKGRRQ